MPELPAGGSRALSTGWVTVVQVSVVRGSSLTWACRFSDLTAGEGATVITPSSRVSW